MKVVLDQARQLTWLKKRYKGNPDWPRRIPVTAENVENIWRGESDNDNDIRPYQMGEGEEDLDELLGDDPEAHEAYVCISLHITSLSFGVAVSQSC
jgi:hypothetical protein